MRDGNRMMNLSMLAGEQVVSLPMRDGNPVPTQTE